MKFLRFLIMAMMMVINFGVVHAQDADQSTVQEQGVVDTQVQAQQKSFQLFVYQDCPYCFKVILFLYNNQLLEQCELIDAGVAENKEKLLQLSGRTQAPYLVDLQADIKMPESLDIIEYLGKKFGIPAIVPVVQLTGDLSSLDDQQIYDEATFFNKIEQSSKPVVILVATTWCPPCKQFKPIFKQVAEKMQDSCEFIIVDGDLNESICERLQVKCYPMLICFKAGQRVLAENYRSFDGLMKLVHDLVHN